MEMVFISACDESLFQWFEVFLDNIFGVILWYHLEFLCVAVEFSVKFLDAVRTVFLNGEHWEWTGGVGNWVKSVAVYNVNDEYASGFQPAVYILK
jgi:hypothetical protein